MPLVVENGQGLEDANSYASVSQLDDYCSLRRIDLGGKDQADKEAALVAATDWINSVYAGDFAGWRQFTQQALEWPRQGITDPATGMQYPLGYMPTILAKATCSLAVEATKGALWVNVSGAAPQLIEKTIGPITKKYNPLKPNEVTAQRNFDEVRAMLSSLMRKMGYLEVCR